MLWVDRLLSGAGVLPEVAWGFACPIHCGSSGAPLLLGFFIGLSVGIGITIAALWICVHTGLAPSSSPGCPVFPFQSSEGAIRRRTRLAGYLVDEQRPLRALSRRADQLQVAAVDLAESVASWLTPGAFGDWVLVDDPPFVLSKDFKGWRTGSLRSLSPKELIKVAARALDFCRRW